MNKTTPTENAARDFQTFFDAQDFSADQIAVSSEAALQHNAATENKTFLDAFLTIVKWIFLYFPGVAVIHFTVMAIPFLLMVGLDDEPLFGVALGMLGFLVAGMFMIMFGIGKLRDLKYLKVVFAAALASAVCAVLFAFLTVFIGGDFFGSFLKITLALPLVIGYLVKRNTDEEPEK